MSKNRTPGLSGVCVVDGWTHSPFKSNASGGSPFFWETLSSEHEDGITWKKAFRFLITSIFFVSCLPSSSCPLCYIPIPYRFHTVTLQHYSSSPYSPNSTPLYPHNVPPLLLPLAPLCLIAFAFKSPAARRLTATVPKPTSTPISSGHTDQLTT